MTKPDPCGDWVLFPASEGESQSPPAFDDELILAAREVWPRVLAHARRELSTGGLGSDRASMAAQVSGHALERIRKATIGQPRGEKASLPNPFFIIFQLQVGLPCISAVFQRLRID